MEMVIKFTGESQSPPKELPGLSSLLFHLTRDLWGLLLGAEIAKLYVEAEQQWEFTGYSGESIQSIDKALKRVSWAPEAVWWVWGAQGAQILGEAAPPSQPALKLQSSAHRLEASWRQDHVLLTL